MNNVTILNIFIHIYFAINIFIAGAEYEGRRFEKFTIGRIFYYLLIVFFAALFYILIGLWVVVIVPIYKRTWLNWAITTIRVWNKHIRKGKPTGLYGNQLVEFRKNVMINKMPAFMRNVWFKIIDDNLQRQRDELAKHGEVSDF
jgi:hypothetical protein